jgi:hypothetical protein
MTNSRHGIKTTSRSTPYTQTAAVPAGAGAAVLPRGNTSSLVLAERPLPLVRGGWRATPRRLSAR